MFSVGDQVVHPMHGAGVIDEIVHESMSGSMREYYVFKMPVGGLLLKIPVSNSETIGIRSIMSPTEADALLSAIPGMDVEQCTNWNKRYRDNMLRLKSGDLYEVAGVIKSLMYRDRQKSLSTGERKMLHNARQILVSELVLAQNIDYTAAEARLDCAMEQPT